MKKFLKKFKPLEIAFKKAALRLFSPILKCPEIDPCIEGKKHWKKILLFRHEKIGDVVITLSLVDALKHCFPGCEVSFLLSPQNVAVIKNDPRFANVFVFTKSFWKDLKTVMAARREKFDCVIDLITRDSVTAMLLTRLCGPHALKIGVGKNEYREYYNVRAPHPQHDPEKHILDFHVDLLKILGADDTPDLQYSPLYIDTESDRNAHEFLGPLKASDRLTIGLNISAGTPTRDWGVGNFLALAREIITMLDNVHLVIITAPNEYHNGRLIRDAFDEHVYLIEEGLDLITVSAIIRNLDMLVSPDTSLVHVGRAFNIPVVGLYRRFLGEYKFWRPYGQNSGLVLSGNEEDVYDITVDQVMDEIYRVIEEFNLVGKDVVPVEKRFGK